MRCRARVSLLESTNEEGRLVSLGGLASALFERGLDDRLVGTFLRELHQIRQISDKAGIYGAFSRTRPRGCDWQLLGA